MLAQQCALVYRINPRGCCGGMKQRSFEEIFLITFSRRPEPHILLFCRPLGTDPRTGKVNPKSSHKMSLRSRTGTVLHC